MLIKNNTSKQIKVLLNNRAFVFNAGDSQNVSERDASFILSIQPALCAVKEEKVVIHSEPAEIETKEEPKAKKNVAKNKKSRK